MDDEKKRKTIAIIIVIVGLIILALIIYFIFFYKFSSPAEQPANNQPTEQAAPKIIQLEPAKTAVIDVKPTVKYEKGKMSEEDVKRLAASFAERFGSFSNQSSYSNILDLKIFMTPTMQDWADNYVKEIISKNQDTSIYYGITTKAIETETKKFDNEEGDAEIMVKTQRREAAGNTKNISTKYEDVLIVLKKKGESWKVDSAYWQKQ